MADMKRGKCSFAKNLIFQTCHDMSFAIDEEPFDLDVDVVSYVVAFSICHC